MKLHSASVQISRALVITGTGFVKQKEMQMLFIEREKGDLCSAGDIG